MIDLSLPLIGPAVQNTAFLRSLLARKPTLAALLHGPPGSGKSHLLDLFALDLVGAEKGKTTHPSIEHVNGQSLTVDLVRRAPLTFRNSPVSSRWGNKPIQARTSAHIHTMSNSMTLLVAVDQATSIRRGIAAPDSTTRLEFDPACFSDNPAILTWIADRFKDGKLRRNPNYDGLLSVPAPNCSGLREAIAVAMGADLAEVEKAAMREKEKLEERRRNTEAALAKGPVKKQSRMHLYGNTPFYDHGYPLSDDDTITFDSSGAPSAFYRYEEIDWPYPRDAQVVEAAKPLTDALDAARADAVAALIARLSAAEAAREAKKAAKAAALRAQLDARAALVGGVFAERHAAGFTVDAEIIALIRADALAARQLACPADWAKERDGNEQWEKPLTDEQFIAWKTFKAKLPEGTNVTIWNAWDNETETDDDGDETTVVTNDILYVEATFREGQVTVTARELLGDCPHIK